MLFETFTSLHICVEFDINASNKTQKETGNQQHL